MQSESMNVMIELPPLDVNVTALSKSATVIIIILIIIFITYLLSKASDHENAAEFMFIHMLL